MSTTYLLVDGENVDATLGGALLGRRPEPHERPRWDRVLAFAEQVFDQPARGLFFLNATRHVPMSFVQALSVVGFRPVLLSGPDEVKVVDVAIERTLAEIARRPDGDVVLASHDGDFASAVGDVLDAGRRAAVLAFRELLSVQLAGLEERGLELHDLEDDVGAFQVALPRLRVVAIDDFDPAALLD